MLRRGKTLNVPLCLLRTDRPLHPCLIYPCTALPYPPPFLSPRRKHYMACGFSYNELMSPERAQIEGRPVATFVATRRSPAAQQAAAAVAGGLPPLPRAGGEGDRGSSGLLQGHASGASNIVAQGGGIGGGRFTVPTGPGAPSTRASSIAGSIANSMVSAPTLGANSMVGACTLGASMDEARSTR